MASRFTSADLAEFNPGHALRRCRTAALDLLELPPVGRLLLDLAGDSTAGGQAVEAALGLRLPLEPNTVMLGEPLVACLRPRRYLVICSAEQAAPLSERLLSLVRPNGGHCFDVSASRVAFRICGDKASDHLAALVPVDLRDFVRSTGVCAQTRLLQANVLIMSTPDAAGFDLHVDRSYAPYVWKALIQAGREFGLSDAH